MDIDAPLTLLGGLSPSRFMRRHWQKKPLLVRQALGSALPAVDRRTLFALAARDDVESRLVVRDGRRWHLRQGPLARRALPALTRPGWTLLVQGLDLHLDSAHELLSRFRFVPDARLDDLMVSYASDRGGVGPHVDSYDVFLLQVAGRRRWRIDRGGDRALRDDVPLKMLARFESKLEWVLEPGDMLYLPPGWAHDGAAIGGDCMTASIGFRAPGEAELAQALLGLLADQVDRRGTRSGRYRDPGHDATTAPGRVPGALQDFARDAVRRALDRPHAIERALGQWLTEPKPRVWFDAPGGAAPQPGSALRLDRRTRMAHDAVCTYVNGEAYEVAARDASVLRRLADARSLSARDVARLGPRAREWVADWLAAGWMHSTGANDEP
ncbi:MAG: cupin domain-containing protein [Aquincola sp.]|nr:cupin domain-containing protein [Aquincola sp.]MDH4289436.1 cupin domain-containing protein [Aquincola sp.]MDH5331262.1 cupin domain-containing protein [Aquincola sp.]